MKTAPILIIDKIGFIGNLLAAKLSREFAVIFVGSDSFSGKFPTISDDKYSHIVVIDDEGLSLDLDFLPSVIKKVKDVNAEFIFAQELSAKSEYWSNKILRLYSGGKVVLYGNIFENNKFMRQAQENNRVQIQGNGLRSIYPIFADDVVNGLIDIIFGFHKLHSLFYVFPRHRVTELSLAHMIQRANPEVKLDFSKKDLRPEIISIPAHGEYLLDDKHPLAQKIRKIDIKKIAKNRDVLGEKKKTERPKHIPLFIVWTLIFLAMSPLIFTLFFSFLGLSTLYYGKTKQSVRLSKTFFYVGKKASNILSAQVKIIGQENKLKNLLKDIDAGYKTSEGLTLAFNAGNYFAKKDIMKGQNELKHAILLFEKMRAENQIPKPFKEKLEKISSLIRFFSSMESIMPEILGIEGERKYLVLFQNSMELRPEGGAIESYGILKLKEGKITDFAVHDTDNVDKQLRGHVEPPFAIRRYLLEKHWRMKNSNFDIDIVKSASSSANFLYAETGEKVSGVIAIDTSFVKNISSLFEQANRSSASYFEIAERITDSLTQKHLMVAFNSDLQKVLDANGWSSFLWNKVEESGESINDFLGINEANLGANKINNFIYRDIFQETMIGDDGGVFSETTIKYKNAGTALSGGAYRNYLRLILPFNTAISEISVNDISQSIINAITDPLIYEAKNFKPPVGLEVEKTSEEDKTIYGFMVNVPAGQIVKVKVKYNLARKAPLDGNIFSYNLKLFKQPGIDSMPYSFSLSYPNSLNVVDVSEGIRKENGKLFYSKKITGDENILIDFAKK
ncbi:MAG: DUF4012 domain-containing protein [Candidatus Levybacteria bacterium]|nr:DUF4012 domain-containing protein [Candidatus Levybacteria bacterium]